MPRDPWQTAIEHLRKADRRWHPIIERVGPCKLRPVKDRFPILVRAIIGQQISTKAAQSINRKLLDLAGEPPRPEALLSLGDDRLRTCGLSGQKASYILNLSEHVATGRLPLARIGRLSDEEIITRMTEVKGIGRWTAEMFLIFALNRPDVLPVHDLGIRVGLRDFHALPDLPKPRECHPLCEPWRPYRSVAMWYFWRHIDAVRSSKAN